MRYWKKFTDTVGYLLCRLDYKLHKEDIPTEQLFLDGWNGFPFRRRKCYIRRLAFGELMDFKYCRRPSIEVKSLLDDSVAKYSYKEHSIMVEYFLVRDGKRVRHNGQFREDCEYSEIAIYEAVLHECIHARQALEKRYAEHYIEGVPGYSDGYLEYKLQPSEYEAHRYSEMKVMSIILGIQAKGKTSPKIEAYLEHRRKVREADEYWLHKLYPDFTMDQLAEQVKAFLDTEECDARVKERLTRMEVRDRKCMF